MADLVLSARLKADADGFIGEIRVSKDEVVKLGKATDKTGRSSKAGARELDNYGSKARKVSADVKELNRQNKSVSDSFRKLKVAIIALGIIELTRRFDLLGLKMSSVEGAIRGAAGSAEAAAQAYAFVKAEADRLGLSLVSAARDFGKLIAAAKGTSLEGRGIQKIFTEVAAAATVMKLSADDTSGAIKAITQIMSKGKVQAEELVGQLGERIPGAFQIASRAMGVTTRELNKMLEQGQVLSEDFLPKFAAELRRTFGENLPNAVKSARAELNRFSNAFVQATNAFAQGGFQEGFISVLKELTTFLSDPAILQSIRNFGAIIGDSLKFAAENGKLLGSVLAGLVSAKIITGFASLAAGIRVATGTMIGFTAALAANPIGLLVVGISAAISALVYFKDELVSVNGESATVWDFIASGAEVMSETVSSSIAAISNAIDDTFGPGTAAVAGDFVLQFIENFALLPKRLVNIIYATAKSITDPFIIAFEEIYNSGKRVFDRLGTISKNFAETVSLLLSGNFTEAWEKELVSFAEFRDTIDVDIVGRSRDAIIENFETDWLGDLMSDLWQAGADATESTIDEIAKRAAQRYQGRVQQLLNDPIDPPADNNNTNQSTTSTELSKAAQKTERFIQGLRAQVTAIENLSVARKLGSIAVSEANILAAQEQALRRAGLDITAKSSDADRARAEIIKSLVRDIHELTAADEAAQKAQEKYEETVKDITTRIELLKPAYDQAVTAAKAWRSEALAGLDATKQGYEEFRQQIDEIYNGMLADAYDEGLRNSDDWRAGVIRGLQDVASEASNWADQTEGLLQNAFKGAEDALVNFVTTGKLSFKDLATSIIADIARIAIQQSITAPLANALGSVVGDIFGSVFQPTSPDLNEYGTIGTLHTGGFAGKETGSKRVSTSVFANADRYHGGGNITGNGLSSNEVPIIALRGERVLTEAQQANTANTILALSALVQSSLRTGGTGGSGGGPGIANINIYNNAKGTTASATQRPNSDGSFDIDVIIEQLEDKLGQNITKGEGLSQPIENRYGLSVATG